MVLFISLVPFHSNHDWLLIQWRIHFRVGEVEEPIANISGAEIFGGNIIFGGDKLDYLQAHIEKNQTETT